MSFLYHILSALEAASWIKHHALNDLSDLINYIKQTLLTLLLYFISHKLPKLI